MGPDSERSALASAAHVVDRSPIGLTGGETPRARTRGFSRSGRWTADEINWFAIDARRTETADAATVEKDGRVEFTPPFHDGPAVLCLTRIDGQET
jgi:hypothetical protein